MYVEGHVDIFDMIDIDLFSVIALNRMVLQLRYTGEFEPLFYNCLRPLTSLDEGLYALACEEDVRCLYTVVRSFKSIDVYIEHGVTAVDSYRRPPPRVKATIEDITDEPGSIEYKSKKMLLTWHDSSEPTKKPVFDYVTHSPSQVIKDVIRQLSFKETELDGEAGFGDVAGSGIEISKLSHNESFGVDDLDLNLNEPVDLNVSQIETQSELPMSEEPDVGRTQEPIMAEVKTQKSIVEEVRTQEPIVEYVLVEDYSSEDACIDDDDEDDDFLVDEENKIVEPDVNVNLFGISMDVPFDNIGVTNLVPDDVLKREDVDVINADGFDSDPGNDDETSNYRRRSQKFTTAKKAKDKVYLLSIESIRNLKLYKNDSVRVRAGCDGKVPVFTMSQGIGPTGLNRGIEVGPSGSSDPNANPIRTLGDYSKPSHEGYMNTIELPVGNNVVPLRSNTIQLVQNGCLFHGLRSEDPNQHLKDFLKLVDSLDLDGSSTTWEDLTTRFLAQFFPPRTAKLLQQLCLYMHDPQELHLNAMKRVLCYLRGTIDLGLQLFRSTTSQIIAYSDADWAGCLATRRAKTEHRRVANAVAETSWIHNLLRELHTLLFTVTLVYCDNVSAVYMSANPIQHQCTKHIEIDIYFIHDKVAAGHVRVLHVPTRFQYADIFTKGLPYLLFTDFRSSLSVCKSPALTTRAY
ncbi:shikimate O-hydroxycinnamoyltransferase [Tanacetum coccineum]